MLVRSNCENLPNLGMHGYNRRQENTAERELKKVMQPNNAQKLVQKALHIAPADRERFQELADQWENETALLSSSDQATEHPAYQAIVKLGEQAVPLILERMQSQGGHWFHALHDITNADPVKPTDHGNIVAMQESWLQWGAENGYA